MVKDSYPLTNIQEILHSLQGATVFSTPDACGAYHAVRIKPGNRACTVFISLFGLFQYIHMIQRIKTWKHILSYCPFEVHTNAYALKYLTTMKN